MSKRNPFVLAILDGYGISLEKDGNPVAHANTPTFNEIEEFFPFTLLQASGVAVGLPWGEAGNSEVGHLTIGSGRIIYHHLPRIIYSIYDGSFFQNQAFLAAAAHVNKNKSTLHIIGLISSGSVHSYLDHLYALLEFTKQQSIPEVFLHVFTDGKDSPPKEGARFLAMVEDRMAHEWPHAKIVSVIGRSFAMDRDEHWERIEKAYRLLTEGEGIPITSPSSYVATCYEKGITDEFIEAATVVDDKQRPFGTIAEGDAIIFFNFREDSMREITHAFVDTKFPHFERAQRKNLCVTTMTEYEKGLAQAAFPTLDVKMPLARVLSEAGLGHVHIAESEKYAHVTYFLNGGREELYQGEKRILVPSLSTSHYDEVPEMQAREITDKVLENLQMYDIVIVNLANADMVGHSGNFEAAIKAVEVLDAALKKIMYAVLAAHGTLLVTADHGNIEMKRNALSGEKRTQHSINPVPLYLIGVSYRRKYARGAGEIIRKKNEVRGILTDVAPTMLELLNIPKPVEMTGKSLVPELLEDINN